jgi:hypothetical protein
MPTIRSMATTLGTVGACAAALATADVVWSALYGDLFLPVPVHTYLFWSGAVLLLVWRIELSFRKAARSIQVAREPIAVPDLDAAQVEAGFQMLLDIIQRSESKHAS